MLDKAGEIKSDILYQADIDLLITEEREFYTLSKKTFRFAWKDFLAELFDFHGRVFTYLHPKPAEYFLDKELVDLYKNPSPDSLAVSCPRCKSDNVHFGNAIDYKWDIFYLIFSIHILAPVPLFRKNFHYFICGNNFKLHKKVDNNTHA